MSAREVAWSLSKAAHWLNSLADDGPDLRINAHIKASHEAAELAAEPTLEELADVAICLVGTAIHQGWSTDEIAEAIADKVAVNACREWTEQADGSWQHVTPEPTP